jgi:hypothetical protein
MHEKDRALILDRYWDCHGPFSTDVVGERSREAGQRDRAGVSVARESRMIAILQSIENEAAT